MPLYKADQTVRAHHQYSAHKTIKMVLVQSWWVFVFAIGCFLIYTRAMEKKTCVAKALREQLDSLSQQKQHLQAEREDLALQIQSQSDPAWIELTLMKGLGLVPDGQMKVFFHSASNESKGGIKGGQAA